MEVEEVILSAEEVRYPAEQMCIRDSVRTAPQRRGQRVQIMAIALLLSKRSEPPACFSIL